MGKVLKSVFLFLCLFLLFTNVQAIEFGGYIFNEYGLGGYKDVSVASIGGGFCIDWQPLVEIPFGIGARLQGSYAFTQNDNIKNHWNAGALAAVWWRFYLGKGFMIKPSFEYGIWLSSIKAKNLMEQKTFFSGDSVLQIALPVEWTNRRFVFSVAPLYTMVFQQTELLNQIGFRLGVTYTTKDILYNHQVGGRYADAFTEKHDYSTPQIEETKMWKDVPKRIVVSPKVKKPILLEIRPEQLEGDVFSVKWKKYSGNSWEVLEGEQDLSLSVVPHATGRFWYCAEITDSKGNTIHSSATQILVHRSIGEFYKDKASGRQGIICDVAQDGSPSLLLSLVQGEGFSLEESYEWSEGLGQDWTLPTIEELYTVILNKDVINETLKMIKQPELEGRYWATTSHPLDSEYVWQWYDVGRLGLERTEDVELNARAVTRISEKGD